MAPSILLYLKHRNKNAVQDCGIPSRLLSTTSMQTSSTWFYPPVTGMEVRALGVLMGGMLESKAVKLLSTAQNTVDREASCNETYTETLRTSATMIPCMKRRPSGGCTGNCGMDHCRRNSISCYAIRRERGGAAEAITAEGPPSEHNTQEIQNQAEKIDVNSEPLYPELTKADKLLATMIGVSAAALTAACSNTTAGAVVGGTVAMAAGAGAWAVARRDWRMAGRLVTEEEAGYEGSRFVEAGAVRAHYLEAVPAGGGGGRASVVLVHGFGASARSYHACMQALADAAQARVVAVDMPGFGLTSRPNTLRDYDPAAMLDRLSAALHLRAQGPVVVVGHSLGGLAAARHLLSAPEPPDAAVLVAPAIVTSRASNGAATRAEGALASAVGPGLSALCAGLARVSQVALTVSAVAAIQALTPLLSSVLRLAVYSKAFWRDALSSAYHNHAKLSETSLEGYRRGAWVRGWEAGVLNFVCFRATSGKSASTLFAEAAQSHAERGLVEEMSSRRVPLLVVHGAQDKIIPSRHGKELAEATESEFVQVERCGHNPMEEQPEEFVRIVSGFVNRLSSQEDCCPC